MAVERRPRGMDYERILSEEIARMHEQREHALFAHNDERMDVIDLVQFRGVWMTAEDKVKAVLSGTMDHFRRTK